MSDSFSPEVRAALSEVDDPDARELLEVALGKRDQGVASPDEHQSTDLRTRLAAGYVPEGTSMQNVYDVAESDFWKDIEGGDTRDDALAKYISKVNYVGQSVDPAMQAQVDARTQTARSQAQGVWREGRVQSPRS